MKVFFYLKYLWFCFILLGANGHQHCPYNCKCVDKNVNCSHRNLAEVPTAFSNTTVLDLRNNLIKELPVGSFARSPKLITLLLSDNLIENIPNGAFTGLVNLRTLYLYKNKIFSIESGAFKGLGRLQTLYLHNNVIEELQPKTFHDLRHLEYLYLHENQLDKIPDKCFNGLNRLKKLRLDSNSIMCDCAILWLVEIKSANNVDLQATCFTHSGTVGTPVGEMNITDIKCTEPHIKSDPENATIDSGTDVMFTCEASGEPEPEIVWLHDSNEIPYDDVRYEYMTNGTLMIHDANDTDTGYFECMAKNPVGVAKSKPAKIIIQKSDVPPQIIQYPKNVNAKMGQNFVHFDCVVKGEPAPRIFWKKNNERMLLNDRTIMSRNGTIQIFNITRSDIGVYTCIVENLSGRKTATAELKVLSMPTFTMVPTNLTVLSGDRVVYTCDAIGTPVPDIIWLKDKMVLHTNENVHLDNISRTLTISKATISESGTYDCRAINTEGMVDISVVLQIKSMASSAPRIVIKPRDTDAFRETTVQLPCEVKSEAPSEIEWRKDGARIKANERLVFTVIGNLVIRNLTLVDTGRYECSVFNEYGRDTVSVFLTVKDHRIPGDEFVHIALTQSVQDIDQAIEKSIKQIFSNKKTSTIKDLFNVLTYPNAPARELAKSAEIYDRTLSKIKAYIKTGLNINMTEGFNYLDVLSPEHLEVIARLSGCTAHRVKENCSDMCYHKKYRSIDGSCNNLKNPTWGASLTPFRRILLPIYDDGFSQPTGWKKNLKYNGFSLPSARKVSTDIITTHKISEDTEITHMVMQWGQWLDHDLDHALPSVSSQTWDGVDCKKTCEYAAPCFPIDVPINDPRVTNRRCIDFVRTSSVCGSGMTSALFGKLQPREQINQLTSFLDASQVYGYEQTVANDLRDLTIDNGTLRVGPAFPGQKSLLPFTGINGMDCRRNLEESTLNCFVAGDIRANEQIGLAAFHTIWMREHNRIATQLKQINLIWSGDKVYNEARKIVGAEIQLITYEHWLPLIVGVEGMKMIDTYKGYNQNINPSISNVFATAALRFGHSIINPVLSRLDENFETISAGNLLLRDAFFSPWRLVDEGGVDPLLRGLFISAAKLKTPSETLNSELTEKLFHSAHAVALDLAAINIQRSRDHAIPSYTKWRSVCNMSKAETFDELKNEISSEEVRNKLETLYGSVYNVDVWVGGILEDQVEGAKVGPLFRCLLVEQFKRLRDGDRFWYENPNMFSQDQLNEIRQTSLARVLCDNGDNIDTITEDVFILPEVQDGLVSCDDLPIMDLRYWIDCPECVDNDVITLTSSRSRRSIKKTNENVEINNKRLIDLEDTFKQSVLELDEKIKRLEDIFKLNYIDT